MVDVVICCSGEDRAAARQLEGAVSRAGYSVWWNDGPADFWHSDAVIEKIAAAKAVIAIWSADSRASGLFFAEASAARAQNKLIQVSADGVEPPAPFEQTQFASIAEWRGEGGHPGWLRISRQLQSFFGAAPAAPEAETGDRAETRRRPVMLLTLLVPAGVAAAALAWTGERKETPAEDLPTLVAAAAPSIPDRPARSPVPNRIAAVVRKPSPAKPAASPDSAPRTTPAKAVRQEPVLQPRVQLAQPTVRPKTSEARAKAAPSRAKAAARRQKALAQRPSAQARVRYQYSENMRLFCQRAGRATRECRTFRRNAKNTAGRPQAARAVGPIHGPPS